MYIKKYFNKYGYELINNIHFNDFNRFSSPLTNEQNRYIDLMCIVCPPLAQTPPGTPNPPFFYIFQAISSSNLVVASLMKASET